MEMRIMRAKKARENFGAPFGNDRREKWWKGRSKVFYFINLDIIN
jgi:hypothetical protein